MRYLYWLQVMAVAVYTHILTKYAVIGDEHTHRRGAVRRVAQPSLTRRLINTR